ncbi:cytidylyltransferase domain-containing protein [Cohnella thailandensis]|uniref:Glycosyltransferase family protein n=1 Tax=Cohnella thailandensis TaxID=557557 RepID=A0A841SKY3_9BACL|nr:glycosyltransferase family protein [Cohnella thailandensis]MBB6632564.1 glycosyltransferase family protein [Cohnella thailandensis]MBP1971858.1 spore coat polysaccharide biosynthesis protein SpsF [Cohnella thailandensis]
MKTLIIIQARMGSSRLPGKVLMPLGDTMVLDYVVSRCRQVKNILDVIVATSHLAQDDLIQQWCAEYGVMCYRGPEDDVLTRYVDTAKPYNPDYVMRVTGDCPFVDYELGDLFVEAMRQQPSDAIVWNGELPRGLVVELVSYEALLRMDKLGREPRHREHVTYYAKEYPEQFVTTPVEIPSTLRYPDLRITLDTEEDYALCRTVADAFDGNKLVSSAEIVEYLNRNPEVAALNSHIEQKPVI